MDGPNNRLASLLPPILSEQHGLGGHRTTLTLGAVKAQPHGHFSVPENLVNEGLLGEKLGPGVNGVVVIENCPGENAELLEYKSLGLACQLICPFNELGKILLEEGGQPNKAFVASRSPPTNCLVGGAFGDKGVESCEEDPTGPLILGIRVGILEAPHIGQALGAELLITATSPLFLLIFTLHLFDSLLEAGDLLHEFLSPLTLLGDT